MLFMLWTDSPKSQTQIFLNLYKTTFGPTWTIFTSQTIFFDFFYTNITLLFLLSCGLLGIGMVQLLKWKFPQIHFKQNLVSLIFNCTFFLYPYKTSKFAASNSQAFCPICFMFPAVCSHMPIFTTVIACARIFLLPFPSSGMFFLGYLFFYAHTFHMNDIFLSIPCTSVQLCLLLPLLYQFNSPSNIHVSCQTFIDDVCIISNLYSFAHTKKQGASHLTWTHCLPAVSYTLSTYHAKGTFWTNFSNRFSFLKVQQYEYFFLQLIFSQKTIMWTYLDKVSQLPWLQICM